MTARKDGQLKTENMQEDELKNKNMNWIKKLFKKRDTALSKPVVIPSLPYDVVIIDQGNGEWYHGSENPLDHRWYVNGNRATCLVCHQVIEKQFRNEE
jgi:hypothetical protein